MVVTVYPVKKDAGDHFPALPVREGEDVFVTIVVVPDVSAYDKHLVRSRGSSEWRERIAPALSGRLRDEPHIARLVPTERSRFPIG